MEHEHTTHDHSHHRQRPLSTLSTEPLTKSSKVGQSAARGRGCRKRWVKFFPILKRMRRSGVWGGRGRSGVVECTTGLPNEVDTNMRSIHSQEI